MVIYSYSRLGAFKSCPRKYKFAYIDKIEPPEEFEGIEAFLGSRVHDTLEKLYRDQLKTKIPTLEELLDSYKKFWDKNWNNNVRVMKKEYSVQNYFDIGKKCLTDYYKRYYPFDQSKTLGLEKLIMIQLDPDGRYQLRGYIDRLSQSADGIYEIRDYKTNSYLPTQSEIEEMEQLAFYQIYVQNEFPDAKEIRLIWNFLVFDKEMVSIRPSEKIEKLKKETIKLIDKIEAEKEFPARESNLCDWCDYQEICPAKKHEILIEKLPENEYLKEEGVVLVDKYARLKNKQKKINEELDIKIEKMEEALLVYARKKDLTIINGQQFWVKVKVFEEDNFPGKNDEGREELEEILRQAGLWDQVSDLSKSKLEDLLSDGSISEKVKKKIRQFAQTEQKSKIFLAKIKTDIGPADE